MSMTDWYHYKVEHCARIAKDATDPRSRADLESERGLWLEIASQIEPDDELRLGPEPN
jgi:hypothetical protein